MAEVAQFPMDEALNITMADVLEAFDKGEEVRVSAPSGVQFVLRWSPV